MTFNPGGDHPQNPYGNPQHHQPHARGPMPSTHLAWAIAVTVLCCLPLGIVAIVKASSVSRLWATGDAAGAQKAADSAKNYVIVSAILGIVAALVSAAIIAFSGAATFQFNAGLNDGLNAAGTSPSATTSSATSSSEPSVTVAPAEAAVCVLNAGIVADLAVQVAERLSAAGFIVNEIGNLSTASITVNTVYYDGPDQQSQAQSLAAELGGVDVEPRPDAFTRCNNKLAVIVVE